MVRPLSGWEMHLSSSLLLSQATIRMVSISFKYISSNHFKLKIWVSWSTSSTLNWFSLKTVWFFQRKYALYILEEFGMLDHRPVDTWYSYQNVILFPNHREPLYDTNDSKARMISEIGWKTKQTHTQANISFAVSAVSQFFQSPCDSHWDAVIHTL